ncbi:MAG: hypothetical protein HZB15_08105, partial [Actinobacteria bacterium]|nr:hypothetical protein [Actinomycetota bacterium]
MASKAWVLAGRELRGRRSSRIGVALVVALGGGAALGSAIAAHRTDHAYHDYVERADVSDLTINPGVWSTDMDRAMRELDGVRSVRAHTMFVATAAWTGPTTVDHPPAEDYWVLMSGSTEGSFLEADRPVVTDGRLPFGTREMFVGNGYRHTLEQIVGRELDVGDVVDLGFWWSLLFDRPVAPGTVVSPISVEPVTISGFGRFPDEVLPDDLFPQQQVVLSPDLAARHSCIAPLSTSMTLEEVDEATAPRTCSSQYWFYSLELEPGVTEQDIRDQFATVADRLNLEELPTALRDIGATHFYIGQARSDVDEAVRRTTRPAVTALVLFAIVSAAVTASILALMAVRAVRRAHGGHSTLRVLGATRRQRVTWSVLPLLQAAGLGVVGAGAVAAALSPIGPLGAVRSVQAGWSVSMPGVVMIPGLVLITVAAAVVIVAAGA